MPPLNISHIERLNKKHYLLCLTDGQMLQLSISDMFSVKVMHAEAEIAYVHFQPLSSLNNIEMPPLYRITNYRAPNGIFSILSDSLLDSILSVYAVYTRGIIRPWRADLVPESRAASVH